MEHEYSLPKFHIVVYAVHLYQVCLNCIMILKRFYKIKIYYNMFLWGPPPSSGKVHFVSYNTAL
jgi:hypothetical protein